MISLLIMLLIICVVLWAAQALISAFSIPQPLARVLYVIIVLIVVIWALQRLGYVGVLR